MGCGHCGDRAGLPGQTGLYQLLVRRSGRGELLLRGGQSADLLGEAGRVLAAEDGEVAGIITPSDLTRWLRRWRTLDGRVLDGRADSRNLDRRY